ncbi:MAG: YajQ family cyclic di-GMP-binding protein [Alphaproteobacteria bacterium]
MPSFDIVSKINMQEVDNAVNSVKRELTNRYDFKGVVFTIELKTKDNLIEISADSEYKIGAIQDSIKVFATKRGVDVKFFDFAEVQKAGGNILKQEIKLKNGIESEIAKKITKEIKEQKLKVQTSIKGDEVRVDGKKRDDLQEVIAFLKNKDFNLPLQFINFRE